MVAMWRGVMPAKKEEKKDLEDEKLQPKRNLVSSSCIKKERGDWNSQRERETEERSFMMEKKTCFLNNVLSIGSG